MRKYTIKLSKERFPSNQTWEWRRWWVLEFSTKSLKFKSAADAERFKAGQSERAKRQLWTVNQAHDGLMMPVPHGCYFRTKREARAFAEVWQKVLDNYKQFCGED